MPKDRKDAIALVIQMSKDRAVCSECNKPMGECECPEEELKEGAEQEEEEHKLGPEMSEKIASDHIKEDPEYYEEEEKSGPVCPKCGESYSECECNEEESPLRGLFQKYERNTPDSVEKINADKEDMKSETSPVSKRVPFRMKKQAKGNKYGPGTPCR
jgi:hypothetical protein